MELIKSKINDVKDQMMDGLSHFAPANIKKKIKEMKQMTPVELAIGFVKLMFFILYHSGIGIFYVGKQVWGALMSLMQGPAQEKVIFIL